MRRDKTISLCKSKLVNKSAIFIGIIFLVVSFFAYFYSNIFNPRAVYIQIGAMGGTVMVANVFFVIIPVQKIRKKSVTQKLNTIDLEFSGKNVLLIDDSIVRGNTSKQIIQMARDAGAKKVYFASASPPIRFPNVYGIDMPYVKELIAYNRSIEEICKEIGADRLIYQDLKDLISAVKEGNDDIDTFDASCFNGEYITGGVSENYLNNLGLIR